MHFLDMASIGGSPKPSLEEVDIKQIDLSKTLTDDQVYETIMSNYSGLSKNWILHQWNWMNNVYSPFKDHYKYLIIISLLRVLQS